MLVELTIEEALKMLLDKKESEKVYFKSKLDGEYKIAKNYRWVFNHGSYTNGSVDITKTNFYKECE